MGDENDIDFSWYSTPQGKDLISSLRQPYGLLEKPLAMQNANYEVLEYKVLLYGKSGVGKTSLVAKLLNCPISLDSYETAGIEISSIYWPIRMMKSGLVKIFKINMWDRGDNACLRYGHFTSACMEGLDGIIFVFSFADKSSFADTTKRVVMEGSGMCKFVVGCKIDSLDVEVTVKEVQEFEEFWKDKVFPSPPNKLSSSIDEVADILNNMCFQLLKRKQRPTTSS